MRYLFLYEEFTQKQMKDMLTKKLAYVNDNSINSDRILNANEILIKNYNIDKLDIAISDFHPITNAKKANIMFDDILSNLIYLECGIYMTIIESIINVDELNKFDFLTELPSKIKGLGLGYKTYIKIIENFDYISSYNSLFDPTSKLWYKLLLNNKYYAITCSKRKGYSCVIKKDISDIKLKEILNNIKSKIEICYNLDFNELILDDFLKIKVKEFYD